MKLGVSYIPAFLPDHIESDMRELSSIGCSEVLFALSENSIYVQPGSWKYGAPIAREYGLEPMAVVWGYANTFGGGRISRIMLKDTGMWVRGKTGELEPHACYNNPSTRSCFVEIAGRLYEAGFTSIFIDEPTGQACWCEHCREKYHRLYNSDLPQDTRDSGFVRFMQRNTVDYVAALCAAVKEQTPAMRTMACIMPADEKYWDDIVSIPELDNFGTDPYWLLSMVVIPFDQALSLSWKTKELAEKKRKQSHFWLNAWRIPAGRENEIYTGGLQLAEAGHDGFYAWSFRGALGTDEESDNPGLVWENVRRLFRELSGM